MSATSVFWGTRRDSSHPWPACRVDDPDAFFAGPDDDGVWWPRSYAGTRLRAFAERGHDALLRDVYGDWLMTLVGYDGPGRRTPH